MDLSKYSDEDLNALEAFTKTGDLSGFSQEGLDQLEKDRKALLEQQKAAYKQEQDRLNAEHARNAAVSAYRGEHPIMAGIADMSTGLSATNRGFANLVSKPFTKEGEPGLGDKIWPKAAGSENSKLKTAGEFLDPTALAIFGAAAKAMPLARAAAPGFKPTVTALTKNAASGAIPGAIVGGLSEGGDIKTGAIAGGAVNAILPPVFRGASKGVGWLLNRFNGDRAAQAILKDAAGADLPAVIAATRNIQAGQTAAQGIAGVESDALNAIAEHSVRGDRTSFFSRLARNQQTDRAARLASAAPDMASAEAARKAATDQLYKAAESAGDVVDVKPVLGTIDDLIERKGSDPRLVKLLKKLRNGLVRTVDKPVYRNGNPVLNPKTGKPATVKRVEPIRNSELVMSAMDSLKNDLRGQKNRYLAGKLAELKKQLADAIPGYAEADAEFARLSAPVNQAALIGEMVNRLAATGGSEGARPLLTALGKGEGALLKKSTGFPRYTKIEQVLTPSQLKTVREVASELERDFSMRRGAAAGSGAAKSIMSEHLGKLVLPNWISGEIAVTNRVLQFFEAKLSKKTFETLARVWRDGSGQTLREVLMAVPPSERSKVVAALASNKTEFLSRTVPASGIAGGVSLNRGEEDQ